MKKFPRTTVFRPVLLSAQHLTLGFFAFVFGVFLFEENCTNISAVFAQDAPEPASSTAPVSASLNDRYIVMRNGSILYGNLKLIGDEYEITNETGTLILPQTNVVQIAINLQQIYTYRASNVFANDVNGRCELVRWCLQYELLAEAEEQIELLRKYLPTHPLLDVFERRIAFLKEQKEAQVAGTVENAPNGSEFQSQTIVQDSNLNLSDSVHRPIGPSAAELDRMAGTLPAESLEIFRKRIQPVLQKNCMTLGCHGPDAQTQFRLLRISPTMARGELLQNLYSALQQIDLTHPEQSPFLRKPVTPHTNDGRIVFANPDYATYQLLIGWTYLVAQNRYVIPRERLIPSTHGVPSYTPTARGLQRVSSTSSGLGSGPCMMYGVSESLYPQALYPQEYAQRPTVTVPQTVQNPVQNPETNAPCPIVDGTRNMPPMKLVLPAVHAAEEPENLENSNENTVIPASGEMEGDASDGPIVPVSGEEIEKASAPVPVPVPTEDVEDMEIRDWSTFDSSKSERSDMPKNETLTPSTPLTPEAPPTVYAPGQHSFEGPIYAPGQNSINGRIYAPGESSADNLRRANPQAGVAASPSPIPAPQSPAQLMYGRDSVERSSNSGAYQYNASSASGTGNSGSNGVLLWEQMLEMQGGLPAQNNK